jgi:hypothetical protein
MPPIDRHEDNDKQRIGDFEPERKHSSYHWRATGA